MRILVTGASGFIGSACINRLIKDGLEVHALSRACRKDHRVHWHQADLFDTHGVASVMAEVRPSHLLHLAWDVTPGGYWNSPSNVEWMTASLRLLVPFGAQDGVRVVMVGSCAEYAPIGDLCSESTTPVRPESLYGAAKAALGTLLPSYARHHGIDTAAWARLFYVYGPGERAGRLVPSSIQALSGGNRLRCEVGTQLRDYVFVEDVAEALARLLCSELDGAVNVGTGRALSSRDLVAEIARQLDASDLVDYWVGAAAAALPSCVVADTTRIRSELQFEPSISHVEGVRRSIASQRERDLHAGLP